LTPEEVRLRKTGCDNAARRRLMRLP